MLPKRPNATPLAAGQKYTGPLPPCPVAPAPVLRSTVPFWLAATTTESEAKAMLPMPSDVCDGAAAARGRDHHAKLRAVVAHLRGGDRERGQRPARHGHPAGARLVLPLERGAMGCGVRSCIFQNHAWKLARA